MVTAAALHSAVLRCIAAGLHLANTTRSTACIGYNSTLHRTNRNRIRWSMLSTVRAAIAIVRVRVLKLTYCSRVWSPPAGVAGLGWVGATTHDSELIERPCTVARIDAVVQRERLYREVHSLQGKPSVPPHCE